MGNKKDRAKAERAARLPKHIGGLKIPKELRRAGAALIEKANSPAGRELIANGLAMAAAAAKASAAKARETRAVAPSPAITAPHEANRPPVANDRPTEPHEIGVALGKMAEAALAGLFAGKR